MSHSIRKCFFRPIKNTLFFGIYFRDFFRFFRLLKCIISIFSSSLAIGSLRLPLPLLLLLPLLLRTFHSIMWHVAKPAPSAGAFCFCFWFCSCSCDAMRSCISILDKPHISGFFSCFLSSFQTRRITLTDADADTEQPHIAIPGPNTY